MSSDPPALYPFSTIPLSLRHIHPHISQPHINQQAIHIDREWPLHPPFCCLNQPSSSRPRDYPLLSPPVRKNTSPTTPPYRPTLQPLITHSVFTANNLHRVFALPPSTTLNLLPSPNKKPGAAQPATPGYHLQIIFSWPAPFAPSRVHAKLTAQKRPKRQTGKTGPTPRPSWEPPSARLPDRLQR